MYLLYETNNEVASLISNPKMRRAWVHDPMTVCFEETLIYPHDKLVGLGSVKTEQSEGI
jgi:hypothetical protein